MKTSWPKIALLVLCCAAVGFEVWHFRTSGASRQEPLLKTAQTNRPDFVLLPPSEITDLAQFLAGPKARIGSWEPTVADMNDIEANLGQITALSSRNSDPSRHIEAPSQYFRQYGAAVIDGRQVLLVNALCSFGRERSELWRKHLIIVNDGGKCYWQAMFDVSIHKFTKLAVNGIA
jgi:hypothetical protein